MDRITLERYRWPFAAARVAAYLTLLAAFAITDPARSGDSPAAASAHPFTLFRRDIIILVRHDAVFVADNYWHPAKLGETLAWMRAHDPRSRVVLRTDRYVTCSTIRQVFAALRDAGYSRVTIETASFRPLLFRRADDPFRFSFDESLVKTPPEEEGTGFEIRGMWF